MRALYSIFQKEFYSFIRPSFFTILGLCSIYFSVYYFSILSEYANISKQVVGGNAELSFLDNLMVPYLSSLNFVLLLVCPFLVVRLFSEEYKSNTFELLITSPINSWQIVLGKYLAACLSLSILIAVAFMYLLFSYPIIELEIANVISAILGVLLLSYVYIAISLFASSITNSVFLAGILSVVLCLALWLITVFRMQTDGSVSVWLSEIWLGTHLVAFLKGGLSLKAFSIYFSYIFFFLFLCQQVVESHRWR